MKKLWITLLLCLLPIMTLAEEVRIIDAEEAAGYTVLLTEEADRRYITIQTPEETRRSGPWPEDTIFCGVWHEGMIELMWNERLAWYGLCPDGEWRLTALHDAGVSFWVAAAPWGMYEPNVDRLIVGNCAADLFTGPIGDALYDMAAAPDRTGWAVVKAESASLYDTPAQEETHGTFFAGTPAKVLGMQGGWAQLSIAADDSLTGWMRADQLAVGAEIAGDELLDIRFSLPESEWDRMPQLPPYHAIGTQGPFLILLTAEGVKYAVHDSLSGADAPALSWGWTCSQGTSLLLALAEDGSAQRLWQGTPLRVLKEDGIWCQVELGDGGLTGWTYKARLAIRDDVAEAKRLPDLGCTAREQIVSASPIPLDSTTYYDLIWPVGETADGSQAILLTWDGAVGLCPSGCVLPENG